MNHRRLTIRTIDQIVSSHSKASLVPDDAVLTADEAAEFLALLGRPVTRGSLKVWRSTRPAAPRFIRKGHVVRYRVHDLRDFALAGN